MSVWKNLYVWNHYQKKKSISLSLLVMSSSFSSQKKEKRVNVFLEMGLPKLF